MMNKKIEAYILSWIHSLARNVYNKPRFKKKCERNSILILPTIEIKASSLH